MNQERRNFLSAGIGLVSVIPLLNCSGSDGTTGVTLAQIQAWAQTVVAELPTMEQTLVSTNTLKGNAVQDFEKAMKAAQAELPVLLALQPGSPDMKQAVQALGNALTIVASFIPAAAPFAPLISMAVMLIEGFLTSVPPPVAIPPAPPAAMTVHRAASRLRWH
jgi:hypothetical protein